MATAGRIDGNLDNGTRTHPGLGFFLSRNDGSGARGTRVASSGTQHSPCVSHDLFSCRSLETDFADTSIVFMNANSIFLVHRKSFDGDGVNRSESVFLIRRDPMRIKYALYGSNHMI